MATVTELIPIIANRAGFSEATVTWVARRLNEAELLPRAVGARVPDYEYRDIATLLIGLLSGANGATVVEATKRLATLKCVGAAIIPGADQFDVLDTIEDLLVELSKATNQDRSDSYNAQLEVVCSWPEVRLRTDSRDVHFAPTEAIPGLWQSDKVRKSMMVAGVTLARIVDDIARLPK